MESCFWDVGERGFLPHVEPCKELPPPFTILESLCHDLPIACAESRVRHLVDAKQNEIAALIDRMADLDAPQLERLHSLFGYLGSAYVRGDSYQDPAYETSGHDHPVAPIIIPAFLAKGWCMVSRKLGRKPMIDYADCVLNNWERLDSAQPITTDNVRLLNRFTGMIDEEWFFKVHVVIEAQTGAIVRAVQDCLEAQSTNDIDGLLAALKGLDARCGKVVGHLALMFASDGNTNTSMCDYFFFF